MGDNLSPAPQLPFRAFLSSKYLQRSSGDKRLTVTGLPVHDNGGGGAEAGCLFCVNAPQLALQCR